MKSKSTTLKIIVFVVLLGLTCAYILPIYVMATNMIITAYDQRLMSAGAAIGVIIFLIAFILVIPYTIYALRKWFE